MDTSITGTRRRSRVSAAIITALLTVAVCVLAIEVRSVWSAAPTTATRPTVAGADASARPKNEVVRPYRDHAVGHLSARQIAAKKG